MVSNENLKFALDLLSLHQSPYEIEVANEISKRIQAGTWLDLEIHPPTQYKINLRGFLPYLWVILGIVTGGLAVGKWMR